MKIFIKKHILIIMLIVGAFLMIAPWPSPEPDYKDYESDFVICTQEMSKTQTGIGPGYGYEGCVVGEPVPGLTNPMSVTNIDYTKVVSRLIGLALVLIVILVCLVRIILWIAHKLAVAIGKERA